MQASWRLTHQLKNGWQKFGNHQVMENCGFQRSLKVFKIHWDSEHLIPHWKSQSGTRLCPRWQTRPTNQPCVSLAAGRATRGVEQHCLQYCLPNTPAGKELRTSSVLLILGSSSQATPLTITVAEAAVPGSWRGAGTPCRRCHTDTRSGMKPAQKQQWQGDNNIPAQGIRGTTVNDSPLCAFGNLSWRKVKKEKGQGGGGMHKRLQIKEKREKVGVLRLFAHLIYVFVKSALSSDLK